MRVAAVNEEGRSLYSDIKRVTLQEPRRKPGMPRNLTITAGDGEITVSWNAPSDRGNPAFNAYKVYYRKAGDGRWYGRFVGGQGRASMTIEALDNGTAYEARVVAINGVGEGPSAGPVTATPEEPRTEDYRVPSAPRNLRLTPGDGKIEVSWDAPEDLGYPSLHGYTVSYEQVGSNSSRSVSASGVRFTITGLTNGAAYEVWVHAQNSQGPGPSTSLQTATPKSPEGERVPGPPRILRLNPGDRYITAVWEAPSDRGNPDLDGYTVYYRESGGRWQSYNVVDTFSSTITGLTNGTEYEVRIAARNSQGTGRVSGTETATPNP